jgi:membrane protein YqaA with SNARE-associated domain
MKRIAATLAAWGAPGVFLLALIDSAGLPLPAGVDALLLLTAATTPRTAYLAAAMATLGSLIGSTILFLLARAGGQRYLRTHAATGAALRFQTWFHRYGLVTVFIPMVVPIVPLPAKVFILSAGALGVRIRQFLITVLAARIPRYFALAFLGSQLGPSAGPWLKAHVWYLVAAAVVLAAVMMLVEKHLDQTATDSLPQA